jgi:hypothetical protein
LRRDKSKLTRASPLFTRSREWEEQTELYFEMDPDHVGIKHQKRYLLEDDEWKFDKIPEVMDGKEVVDCFLTF